MCAIDKHRPSFQNTKSRMPKASSSTKGKKTCALEKQLAYDERAKTEWKTKKVSPYAKPSTHDEPEDETVVPDRLTQRTLALAKAQQEEVEAEAAALSTSAGIAKTNIDTPFDDLESEPEDDDDLDEYEEDDEDLVDIDTTSGYVTQRQEMLASDELALESFMSSGPLERRNLADLILEKIQEKEAREALASSMTDDAAKAEALARAYNPKIVQVYAGVGKLLKRYTSGKLPKAFKVVPSLRDWDEILWLTEPDKWTPHAMRAATRLFASNLNPKRAQRFYNVFLLEHVRQDIRDNKRLNFHLYMALKKALYKPQAFFKGIVLPLCEPGGNCTLREATIVASVLLKVSIPVIHSAAALLKLAELPYSGASSLFIRMLLQKKYSLPTRVVAQLCTYFCAFVSETRTLPVLWHQALLIFTQRYKNDIPTQVKDQMKALMKVHFHHQITPEIRRELFQSTSAAPAANTNMDMS